MSDEKRGRGRPKGSTEMAWRMRSVVEKALDILEERYGIDTAAELVADDMITLGVGVVAKQFAPYYPKVIHAEVTQHTPEQWLEMMADADAAATPGVTESTGPAQEVQGLVH